MLLKHPSFILFLYFLLQALPVVGQNTKTSLSGKVVNESQAPVAGAYITITHLPTGTQYGCATNESGKYFIPNLRPGGAYQIETTNLGFKKYQVTGIFFKLDEPAVLHINLQSGITELSEVSIIAEKPDDVPRAELSGPLFNIRHQEINLLPSIKRSIMDFVRLSPQAFGAAIAGGNYRQNFLTIDGSEFNNNFGVGDNLPGNGAQPISLDAIAEIAVNVAPYQAIWQSGFIGSAVNIVSRSGSNQTEGAVYTYLRNQDLNGYRAGSLTLEGKPLQYHLEGLRLGGPLVKNKLFYFISLEQEKEQYQAQQFQAATADVPYGTNPNVARPTDVELNTIKQYLWDTYQYDTGPYQGYDFINKSNKILVKLDWNIAENSTLSVRYNQLHSSKPELVNGSRSPLVPFSSSYGRRTANALPFSHSNFNTLSNFYSLAAEWNNRLNSKLTNTMRSSYTRQYEPRVSESRLFPFVDILKDGTPFTSFGYEPYTYANSRAVNVISFTDHIHWMQGKGTWIAGLQADYSNTKNSYMPFSTGYYTYASWEDFSTGKKPLDYAVTYTNEAQAPEYSFDYLNTAAFLQYTTAINDRLSLTAGLRTDLPIFLKSLPENELLATLRFAGGQQLHTSLLPKANVLIAPRLAFNYDLLGDKSLNIRGGTGLFTGRIPFVWIISQARYSGVSQLTQTWQGQQNTPGVFNPDYAQPYNPQKGNALPAVTSVLSRNFKMPQTWKSSIGLDLRLPFDLRGSVEVIYNRDINGIVFKDLNLREPTPLTIPGYPDHRLVYPSSNNLKFLNPLNVWGQADNNGNTALNAVEITNASKGYYLSAIAQIEKRMARGVNLSVAYSRSSAKNYNDGNGDQTLSALNATPSVNGINQLTLGYAGYVPPHHLVSTLTWNKQYAKNLKLTIGLVYQGAHDGRFSYTYSKDFIGDGTNRSLIYIPNSPNEIRFVPLTLTTSDEQTFTYSSDQQSEAFFNYIKQDKYLRSRKGSYAERNGALMPWRQQVDLKISHEVSMNSKGKNHRLELSCDLLNLGNFINRHWGTRKLVNAASILSPANLSEIKPNGDVLPTFQMATIGGKLVTETFRTDYSTNSTYLIQFGIRYSFQ